MPVVVATALAETESPYSAVSTPLIRGSATRVSRSNSRAMATFSSAG